MIYNYNDILTSFKLFMIYNKVSLSLNIIIPIL